MPNRCTTENKEEAGRNLSESFHCHLESCEEQVSAMMPFNIQQWGLLYSRQIIVVALCLDLFSRPGAVEKKNSIERE